MTSQVRELPASPQAQHLEKSGHVGFRATELSLSNIRKLTGPQRGLLVLNVGAENKISVTTKPGDKTLNIGNQEEPNGPLVMPEGSHQKTIPGDFYAHRGPLQDLKDIYDVNLNPDLILVICPNPNDLPSLMGEIVEASGPHTSVVISLETDSHEMQSFGYDQARNLVMDHLESRFPDVIGEISSLNEALEETGVDRLGTANSRMNYGDKYEFIVATH